MILIFGFVQGFLPIILPQLQWWLWLITSCYPQNERLLSLSALGKTSRKFYEEFFCFWFFFRKNDVFIQLFMFFMFRIFKIFVSFWKIRFRKILCKISRNACMFMFKSRIPEMINQVSESGHMSDRIGHIEGHSNWNKSVLVVSIITYVLS